MLDDVKAYFDSRPAYAPDTNPEYREWLKARQDAWHKLRDSSDPMVRWIADNCGHRKGEAETILRMLPASLAQMDAVAKANRWCEDWDELRDQAIRDGAIQPGIQLQVRIGSGQWRNLRDAQHWTPSSLDIEQLTQLFTQEGVSHLSMVYNGNHVMYQAVATA